MHETSEASKQDVKKELEYEQPRIPAANHCNHHLLSNFLSIPSTFSHLHPIIPLFVPSIRPSVVFLILLHFGTTYEGLFIRALVRLVKYVRHKHKARTPRADAFSSPFLLVVLCLFRTGNASMLDMPENQETPFFGSQSYNDLDPATKNLEWYLQYFPSIKDIPVTSHNPVLSGESVPHIQHYGLGHVNMEHQEQSQNSQKILVGECAPSYLHMDGASKRIASTLPEIKAVFIFRDPIDRAYLNYLEQSKSFAGTPLCFGSRVEHSQHTSLFVDGLELLLLRA
jgi:hypothetical protein